MATSTEPPTSEYGSPRSSQREWCGADGSCRISISNRILEEIRFEVSRAMNGPGSRGVGGVLQGTREGDHFSITGYRPIPCTHASGPEFRLSKIEESELPAFLEGVKIGPVAEDEQRVGWLVSHPRGDLTSSVEEREFHQKFFGDGQVMIVAKPDRSGDMDLAVHYGKGDAAAGLGLVEPVLSVAPDASFRLARRTLNARRQARETPISRANPKRITMSAPERTKSAPAKARRSGFLGLALLVLIVASVCGGIYWYRPRFAPIVPTQRASQGPIEMLSLHAYETGGRFYISWDGHSAAILRAAKTILSIRDAGRTSRYELSGEEATSGVYVYSRTGAEVNVTLEVKDKDGGVVEESTHYANSEFNAPELLRLSPDTTPTQLPDPVAITPDSKKF